MSRPLALEFISALGMPPDAMVDLVSGLGLSHFGLAAQPITRDERSYPAWNLVEDKALRTCTRDAMAQHGVELVLGEGFLVTPGQPPEVHRPALDVLAELGARRVNAVSLAGDDPAAQDAFAAFAQQAAARGMATTVEFLPMMPPADLRSALAFAEAAGIEVLVDAMHFFRSGSALQDLARAGARIGHVQICDAPMPAREPDYGREAAQDRLPPGEGDLPLAAFIAALPADVTIGLELPMLRRALSGTDMGTLLAPAVAAAKRLL